MDIPLSAAPAPAPIQNPPETIGTNCCALSQIQAYDNTGIRELQRLINYAKKCERRAVFVITKVEEPNLVKRLKKLKFKKLVVFNRKKCYEQKPLTMWMLQM